MTSPAPDIDNNALLVSLLHDAGTRSQTFSAVVAKCSEKIYWQVRAIVGDHDDANDVVQNAFIKAWQHLATYEGKAHITTWISRIAINEALDMLSHRQRQRRLTPAEMEHLAATIRDDNYFDGGTLQAHLAAALTTLPAKQRTVFTLRYYNDMPYAEMSALLGTSEGALKADYHHAVRKIKHLFGGDD